MYFSSHLSDKQYFLSQKIDKNVVYLATTEDRSGLTRQELQCVVTRNETLSGYRNCIVNSVSGWSNLNKSNRVNSVNVVNSVQVLYSAVVPPSLMVFFVHWFAFLSQRNAKHFLILQSSGESIWFWSGAPVPWWTIVSPFAYSSLVILNIFHFDEAFQI